MYKDNPVNIVTDKIDRIYDNIEKLLVSAGKQEKHLENLNGAVARHEKQLGKQWDKFDTLEENFEKKLCETKKGLLDKINIATQLGKVFNQYLRFAKWLVYLIGLLVLLIGLVSSIGPLFG